MNSVTALICLSSLLLGSTASTSTSLWGKKVQLKGRTCIWQLQPDVVIPALAELSVCMLIRRSYDTDWTGFDYKAPGGIYTELGLGGTAGQMTVWLFGEKQILKSNMKLHEWQSVCVTWSGPAQRLQVYINGTRLLEAPVSPKTPRKLAPGGTLTLGVSHYVAASGEVKPETGKELLGDIGLFRIWAREWSAVELSGPSCADGDVVRWDLQHWRHGCPAVPDSTIHCGKYAFSFHDDAV
ncbi:adhesion G-protein coupled receptor G4-like [Centropristis striata]|uniref:adhesion G-protein coupled receptor G4-like n=1 Tax=Centropristis striata TaxID=184440 RepID=UPI0027DEF9C2|nr:adhesion G-protein coupled receptor G4-like [Centropristis striata]